MQTELDEEVGQMADAPDPRDPETIDRNWNELLQEIRVMQTGVQILTGFLLTLPFTARFTELDDVQRGAYLVVLSGSVLTTACVVAPAAFHRLLFRRRAREWLVEAANQCTRAGLVLLALTVAGALFLVFDVVVGTVAGVMAMSASLVVFTSLWVVVPLALHGPASAPSSPAHDDDED